MTTKQIIIRAGIFLLLFISIDTALFSGLHKIYKTSTGRISFYSETPVEDIEAASSSMSSAIDPASRNIACLVLVTTFQFKNGLMQEHFNEKYLESDKFPKATFSGVINELIDFNKPGTYAVTATGKLNIHGIEKPRTIKGTIIVDEAHTVSLDASFDVALTDHNIEVPQIVFNKIAEVINVKIHASYILQ